MIRLMVNMVIARMDDWWEEVSPKRRLDFNFGNMAVLFGLMVPTLGIILSGPVPNSALNDMPFGLQIMMCVCIFCGCAGKLHGALSGRRFYFPNTTLRRSYQYGYWWAPAATTGLLVYGWYLIAGTPTFWSAFSAIATPIFGVGIAAQAVIYWLEARRIGRNEDRLKEVVRDKLL